MKQIVWSFALLAYIMLMIALIPSLVCTDLGEGFRAYKRGDYTWPAPNVCANRYVSPGTVIGKG